MQGFALPVRSRGSRARPCLLDRVLFQRRFVELQAQPWPLREDDLAVFNPWRLLEKRQTPGHVLHRQPVGDGHHGVGHDLRRQVAHHRQVEGLWTYTYNVPFQLGSRVDFAQLIKSYASSQTETRYSPATITGIEKIKRFGNPDMDKVSTSYSERLNLSVRMHVRRYTRLTNAHSKTARHHAAMTSLFVAWYNYCRKHESLKKMTPAIASGLVDNVWTIKRLLQAVAA